MRPCCGPSPRRLLLCAVVKADAYGHGAVPVATAALAGGATTLAVALVEEGVVLREAGLEVPILVLSEPAPEAMEEVVSRDLIPTVYTRSGVAALSPGRHRRRTPGTRRGEGRHRDAPGGRRSRDRPASSSRRSWPRPSSCYAGLWTHLAVADEPEDPFTGEQLGRFEQVRKSLQEAGIPRPARIHAANSAGAIAHPGSRYDVVRCGISLYGYLPSPAVPPRLVTAAGAGALRPALSWKTQVSFMRELAPG